MNFEMYTENGIEIVVPLVRRLDSSVALIFKQQVLSVIEQDKKMCCCLTLATSILLIVVAWVHWSLSSKPLMGGASWRCVH